MDDPNNSKDSGVNAEESDQDFDPSAEMLVNDFDDEHTLDEEESLTDELTTKNEIDELTKEQDIPIEELIKMYCDPNKQPKTSNNNNEKQDLESSESSSNSNQQQTSNDNQQQLLSDSSDEDSDYEFSANEDEWRRTIQVGSDYQAVIPDGLKHYDANSTIDKDEFLLWKPSPKLTNDMISNYLIECNKIVDNEVYCFPISKDDADDEKALYTLLVCKYDIKEALKRYRTGNVPKAPIFVFDTPWTEEECTAFESGLRDFGKDFFQIKHTRVPNKTVGEIVSFYYLWKKTERHDTFVNKYRVEKKRYNVHPGTTDYMDRFLDEQETVLLSMQQASNMNNLNPNTSSNVQTINSIQNYPSSSSSQTNHHLALNHQPRQSSSSSSSLHNSAQSSSRSSHLSSESYLLNNNNSSISITPTGHHSSHQTQQQQHHLTRTINITNDLSQTIHINDSNFVSNNNIDKPIVVCTGSSSNPTTIIVGKNEVVIDGNWLSSQTPQSSSNSTSSANTQPSVSIYKLPPHSSSSFNR